MKTAPKGGIRGRHSVNEDQPFHPLVSICQFEKLGQIRPDAGENGDA